LWVFFGSDVFFLVGAGALELGGVEGAVGVEGVVGAPGVLPEPMPPPPLLPELLEPLDGGVGDTGALTGLVGTVTGVLTGVVGGLLDELLPPEDPPLLSPVTKSGPANVLAGGAGASAVFAS
jgi:hypothetical protein